MNPNNLFGPEYGVLEEQKKKIKEEPKKILSNKPTMEDWKNFLSDDKRKEWEDRQKLRKPSEFAPEKKKKRKRGE